MSAPFPAACVYLTGPTASGKTSVGIELARLIGAEIVAMDSMTLYRGMDIGTAKPTASERAAVPHHLLDIVEPHEEFSQAEYAAAALKVCNEIIERGRVPLFVGGTPLYLKTLLRGMSEGPAANWTLRRELETQSKTESPDWLHQQVAAVDSAAAAKLHVNDTRRLIRALEVYRLTGMPISVHQQHFDVARTDAMGRVLVLDWPREELYARIDRRVDAMLTMGLLDEVRQLTAISPGLGCTARQALGYRETLDCLSGRLAQSQLADAIKTHTRQFAKRQLTWFRSLPECRWIPMQSSRNPRETARRLYAHLWKRKVSCPNGSEAP